MKKNIFKQLTSRTSKLIYIVLCIIFIASCGKNDNNNTQVSNGKISGSVTPTDAAFVVRAVSGTSVFSSPVDASGNYTISNLPYGNYTLQAYPVGGYSKPSAISVNVNSPSNSQSPIIMPVNNSDGNITYTLDGTNYSLFSPLTFSAYNGFGTTGFLLSSQTNVGSVDHWTVGVTLNNFNGVGSYPVANTVNFNFSILKYVGATIYVWGTVSGGSGTVNVNSMDTTSHRISGTFIVTAVPQSANTSGNMTISNGVFTNLYYRK